MKIRLLIHLFVCCSLVLGCNQNLPKNPSFKEAQQETQQETQKEIHKATQTEKEELITGTIQNSTQQPTLDIKYEIKSYDTQKEAATAVSQLARQGSQNLKQTTVVSSESLNLINELYSNKSFREIKKTDSIFIVYNNSVGRFAKSAAAYVQKSYQDDKIGFIIATYTTAVETVMWIHVAPLSIIEKSANIVYTIGLALYFKINKDKWTEHTKNIRKPFEYFFKKTGENSRSSQVKYDFLANLTLATALSFVRIPLMSMNQILDSGISFGLFQMPLLLSIAGTAAFFTWSEHQGNIDKDTQPISKFVFRRFSELRSVLIATYASTAALLNPTIFGVAPWITLAVIGIAGLGIYLKGEQINNWTEKHLNFKKLEKIIRYNSSIFFRCENLFLIE